MKSIMLLLVGTALTCFVYGYGCILSPSVDCELTLFGVDGRRRWSSTAEASGKTQDDCWRKACARMQTTLALREGVGCSSTAEEFVCDCGYDFTWTE